MYLVIYVYNHCVHANSSPTKSLCPICVYLVLSWPLKICAHTDTLCAGVKIGRSPNTPPRPNLGGGAAGRGKSSSVPELLRNDPVPVPGQVII